MEQIPPLDWHIHARLCLLDFSPVNQKHINKFMITRLLNRNGLEVIGEKMTLNAILTPAGQSEKIANIQALPQTNFSTNRLGVRQIFK